MFVGGSVGGSVGVGERDVYVLGPCGACLVVVVVVVVVIVWEGRVCVGMWCVQKEGGGEEGRKEGRTCLSYLYTHRYREGEGGKERGGNAPHICTHTHTHAHTHAHTHTHTHTHTYIYTDREGSAPGKTTASGAFMSEVLYPTRNCAMTAISTANARGAVTITCFGCWGVVCCMYIYMLVI
jgi:hypothetical protein